jgi:hypothetical protein
VAQVAGYVRQHPGCNRAQLKDLTRWTNETLGRTLKEAEDRGLIYTRQDGPSKRHYPASVPLRLVLDMLGGEVIDEATS